MLDGHAQPGHGCCMSQLLAILYRSEALMPQGGVKERQMLDLSRSDNVPRQVTGFLHREHDIYYQWIEGPEAEVDALFAKIRADTCHSRIKVLSRHEITDRNFSGWSMGYGNTSRHSLFDWAAQHDIPLHPPRPQDILTFMKLCANR